MKVIEVKDQVRLSPAKCLSLVLSGVRFRLFRAAITVLIISLAAAFLMTMLGEGIIGRRVAGVIERETAPRDKFLFWASRISSPMTAPELVGLLAGTAKGQPRWRELRRWGKLSDDQMARLVDLAVRQMLYEDYFAQIEPGERRPLIGLARGEAIFEMLQSPEKFKRFREELRNISRQMPTTVEAFESFLGEWARTRPLREKIRQGHRNAVENVKALLGAGSPKQVLAEGRPAGRDGLGRQGFEISREDFDDVAAQAALACDAERIAALAGVLWFKAKLADREGIDFQKVEPQRIFGAVASIGGAKWLLAKVDELKRKVGEVEAAKAQVRRLEAEIQRVRKQDPDSVKLKELEKQQDDMKLSPKDENLIAPSSKRILQRASLGVERIAEVARYERRQRRLAGVEVIVARSVGREVRSSKGKGWMRFPVRTMWLLAVSFLVCIVGIANAMLMSVTERFREIATMKCLGATDGFIMINFILESIMQGVVGSVVGAVLGFVLGSLRGWARYGQITLDHFPLLELSLAAGISVGIGVIISALAAVYPAWVAARLAPMEAMRIE